tara:strand:- start:9206 stop:10000 length:795 start_codon:yes stop_codon:yes gene_type:complete
MIKNRFTLQNKIILITGASGKLANDFIKDFINNDAIVIGIDIKDDAPIFDELNVKLKNNFFYYKTDISNKKELSKIFDDLELKKLLPNTLINNAAAGQVTFLNGSLVEFTEFPQEVWDENLKVNLTGALNICQIFGKYLEENKSGSIINMSSTYGISGCDQRIYGDSGLNSSIAYAATKSALIGMTKYLAAYWGSYNIRVNAVAPAGVFNNHKDPFYSNYVNKIMLGKMCDVDDISNALIYLASDASKYITGTVLSVDGGYTAW